MKAQISRVQSLLKEPDPNPGEALVMLNSMAQQENPPWPVFYYLGIVYMYKKDFETALRWLKKALPSSTDQAITYHAISVCHYNLTSFDKAEEFVLKALNRENYYKGWMHLGAIYRAQAKLEKALNSYKKAAELEPDNTGIAHKMAEIYRDHGRLDKALELFEYSVKEDEDNHTGHLAMAKVLITKEQFEKAQKCLNEVLESDPENVAAQTILSYLYRTKGDYKEAIEVCEKLLEKNPKAAKSRLNYAICLQELGKFDSAERHYLQALEDQPDEYQSLSNYLMCLHYNPEQSKEDIFEAHKLWDQHFAPEDRPERPVPSNKSRDKKLRIGFISGGFQSHPVGWMITRALENLSQGQFEIYCYTTNNRYDQLTQRIADTAAKWRSVIGYNDEVIARMIREDEIDILVELSGHAADNRLRTIALEPAPVIVKWVGGLFNTTGLQSVDYLITDHYESPKGEEEFYTEKLVRMPDDYVCYLPPDKDLEIGPVPFKENGFITLGCFNNPSKVNNEILEQWAKIMDRLPESRLMLKSKQYDTEALREQIIAKMEESGISEDRILFRGHTKHSEHLAYYNKVDIALDPWPYSGGLTTCEALWMGVPVITKPGPTFAGRHSATHLTNVGFQEWVVDSWDKYVNTTVDLANNPDRLSELRKTMRDQVESSPLCDGQRFGAHLGKAFREMWKQRVDGYESHSEEWQDHIEIEAMTEEEIKKIMETSSEKAGKPNIEESKKESSAHQLIEQTKKETEQLLNKHSVVNGINKNGASSASSSADKKVERSTSEFKIKTKDGVLICTPDNLNLLTPFVLIEQGEWFESELSFVREYVSPGMNVVDVGAGFGVYALPMANQIGEGGKVYAFEPEPRSKRYLEQSKLENGLKVNIIGKAVSDQSGKAKLAISETPELSNLDDGGTEEITKTTLDSWWEFESRPNINFIKIDVNGHELKVLKGAEKLLSEQSPVVMFAIGEGSRSDTQVLEKELQDQGYKLYEFVPGLQQITDHNTQDEVDPFLMNLIAIKDDREEEFKKAGWIYDESTSPDKPESGLWKEVLQKLPWTNSVFLKWEEQISSSDCENYLKALDYLCAAEKVQMDEVRDRSRKGAFILEAVQILVQLYNDGDTGAPVAMSLARGLNALGKRGQASSILKNLTRRSKLDENNLNVDLPFLPPLPGQDKNSVKTSFSKWVMVRIVEAELLLNNVTTYLSDDQDLKFLAALEGNPENQAALEKRFALAAIREKMNLDDSQKRRIARSITGDRNKGLLTELLGNPTEDVPNKIIPNDFWDAPISQQKGEVAVNVSEKLKRSDFDGNIKDVIKECQQRIDEDETDGIAFFLLVKALLLLKDNFDHERNDVLANQLKKAGWEHKESLYFYFFDFIEQVKQCEDPSLSVIVVSNRVNDDVLENLEELDRQKDEHTEIIFVNNGLRDDAIEGVREYVNQLVHLNQNAGACMARNFGALFSKSDLVVFVDDDGFPAEGMLEAHRKIHNEQEAHVARGVYEPKTESSNKPEHYNLGSKVKPAVCYLEGNTSFEAAPFYDVDGWNDAILVYHEGFELSYRYFKKGYDREKLIYFPDAVLKHDYTKSPDSQRRKKKLSDSSYVLIQAMYDDDLGNVISTWPDSFISSKSVSTSENSEYQNLSRVCYLAPGETDAAYGLHNKQAKILAEQTRNEGIRADILYLTDPEFLKKIVDISREPGHAVHSGVMGYPAWVTIDRVQNANLFDLLDVNIFGVLGDHLFASFMWQRLEKMGNKTTFYSIEKSMLEELDVFGPGTNASFTVDYLPPVTEVDEEAAQTRHESREIDILVPWSLNPNIANAGAVQQELSKMGDEVFRTGKVLMEKLRTTYDQSFLSVFEDVYSSVIGGQYEFNRKKTKEDYRWMNMLHLVDQHVRHWRRFDMLQPLVELPNDLNIVITAEEKQAKGFEQLQSQTNIQWIGQVTTEKLDQLYANSRILLNCNPTYPDYLHERVINGMTWGCCVVSDQIWGLSKRFDHGKEILFDNKETNLAEVLESQSGNLQEIADNAREWITDRYTQQNFCRMLLQEMDRRV